MKSVFMFVLLLILVSVAASAPEPTPGVKAEMTALNTEISVRGTFVPAAAKTVVPRPEGWNGRYVVEFAVEPGTVVKQGDVVLRFDARAIREAVEDARFDLGHWEFEHEMELARQLHRASAAARDMERKRRDFEHFVRRMEDWKEYEKPRDAARAALDRKGQDQTVQNAEEELKQLEKMYEEDELVDDTEEIVIERSRWNLERRRKYREWWIEARERTEKIVQPRYEEQMNWDLDQKTAALHQATEEYEMGEAAREISVARAKRAWAKKQRSFERLEHVLSTMEIRAPADGILLHGPLEGATGRLFKPGTQVNAGAAVISIAQPGNLVAELTVPAKEALRLRAGTAVRITPDAIGAKKVESQIGHRTLLPTGGNFTIRCELPGGAPAGLLGTACAATIVLDEAKDVLTVPANAVFRVGARAFVRKADGMVAVKTGREAGGRVEILQGLSEGDEILPAPAESK